jgi:hypothetical protein
MKPDELLNRIESKGFYLYVDGETLKADPDTMSSEQRSFIQANAQTLVIALYNREKQLTRELFKELKDQKFIGSVFEARNQPVIERSLLKKIRVLCHPDKHNNSQLSNEAFKAINEMYLQGG